MIDCSARGGVRRAGWPAAVLMVFAAMVSAGGAAGGAAEPAVDLVGDAVDAEQEHFFEQRVRPILAANCYECHATDARNVRGGLVLDTAAGPRLGGDSGPAIVPGDAEASRLIEAVRYHDRDTQMPPRGRMDDQAIRYLEQWVEMGAPDPRPFDPADVPHYAGIDWEAGREHWAFQPVQRPQPPAVEDEAWVRHEIDRYVLARLEQAGLEPAAEADRYTWLRRVTYDLTGLPPTVEAIDAFVNDDRPDAYERVVDRLLASSRYGERWGRHWLDLARYADSNGADENLAYANAWRYRDYVIDAFNADKPYDQFITEQLAGDLMPTPESDEELFERWTALGYLAVGQKVLAEQDKEKMLLDVADEQIDVVSQSLLGLTVSCARCHDHKFDPVTEDDYYALAGVFRSTEMLTDLEIILSGWRERPLATQRMIDDRAGHAEALDAARQELEQATAQVHAALADRWRSASPAYLQAATQVLHGEAAEQVAEAESLEPILLARWVEQLEAAAAQPASPLALWVKVAAGDGAGDDLAAAHQAFLETVAPLAVERLADAPLEAPDQLADVYQQYFEALADAPAADADLLELREGRLGQALYTDGRSYRQVAHEPELEPQQLTLEAWIYAKEQGEGDHRRWIVAKNPNEWADGHYGLIVDRNRGGAYLNIGGGADNAFVAFSSMGTVSREQWHHLAMTFDNERLRLYVDGELADETRVDKPRTAGDGPLNFGRRPDGYVNFHGRIDEVRLYDRPLDMAEVAARHEQPAEAIESGLVRAWTFDNFGAEQLAGSEQERLRRALYEGDGLFAVPEPPEPHYRDADRDRLAGLTERVRELEATLPPEPPTVLSVFEAEEPVDLPVHIRGSHLTLADEPTPRRTPEIFDHLLTPPQMPDDASGRLELAEWLTHPDHPLTARVKVNRIWQHHFGEGIVRSVSNFGLRGEEPTHPELLDYLATLFVEEGWSIQQMHRHILLSSAYRMSTAHDSVAEAEDPENRLLWRMNRQRLEAEPIRDALLAIGGTIDLEMGGSMMQTPNTEYVRGERNADYDAYHSQRRSIYLPVIRNALHPMFTVFDYTDAGVTIGQRPSTTVSHQALFMMNAPVVLEQAEKLAHRLLAIEGDDAERVRQAYLRALGRPADEVEIAEALAFIERMRQLAEQEDADAQPDADTARAEAWQSFCHLLFASSEFIFID